MEPKTRPIRLLVDNRKARFEYELLETLEAGIALVGTEVKALRSGQSNLQDAYVEVRNDGAWLLQCHIPAYTHGNRNNHEPRRPRRLLLKQAELSRLHKGIAEKGMTVIPLRIYLLGSLVKVEIALARGRKLHDKRAAIKDRELKKEIRQGRD